MKTNIIIVLVICFFCNTFSLLGQNLIPNGSFEDTVSCPIATGEIENCAFWIRPSLGTSDYFNICSSYMSIPNSNWVNQQPFQGVAYAGFVIVTGSGVREYVESPLVDSLKSDSCYHFQMYVTLGNTNLTSDDIQVYFSDTLYKNMTTILELPLVPQIINPPGNFFDSLNWTMVSGEYMAHGGEKYIIIGNFYDNAMSTVDTIYNIFIIPSVYVAIDSVSLTPTICTSIENIKNSTDIKVWPNPANNELTVQAKNSGIYEFILRNKLSQIVRQKNFSLKEKINVGTLPAGTYFYQIMNESKIYATGKIICIH